jgi:hypothetical protein
VSLAITFACAGVFPCTAKSSTHLVITRRGTHAGTYVAIHPPVVAVGENYQRIFIDIKRKRWFLIS